MFMIENTQVKPSISSIISQISSLSKIKWSIKMLVGTKIWENTTFTQRFDNENDNEKRFAKQK